jgi:hypothetical protein
MWIERAKQLVRVQTQQETKDNLSGLASALEDFLLGI